MGKDERAIDVSGYPPSASLTAFIATINLLQFCLGQLKQWKELTKKNTRHMA
jgi:hypothetical protein